MMSGIAAESGPYTAIAEEALSNSIRRCLSIMVRATVLLLCTCVYKNYFLICTDIQSTCAF